MTTLPKIKLKISSTSLNAPTPPAIPAEQPKTTITIPSIPAAQQILAQQKKKKKKKHKHKERDEDEDEKAHPIEEHLILRMPKGDSVTAELKEMVQKRQILPIEIQWKEARRGIFLFHPTEGSTDKKTVQLNCQLVDLPTITESMKTLDQKQFYKVADISQMIQVSRQPIPGEVENSGLTKPLQYVRLRRFRKRVNKRTVESIEREVSRMLKEDAKSLAVETQFLDPSEIEERLNKQAQQEEGGEDEDVQVVDIEEDEEDEDEAESQVDSDFQQELEDELAKAIHSEEESEEEEEEEEEQKPMDQEEIEEDEEMEEEMRQLLEQQRMVREEMKELDEKIKEKQEQAQKSQNVLIQKRFEEIVKKLSAEKEKKVLQLEELEQQLEDFKRNEEEQEEEYKEFMEQQQQQQQQQQNSQLQEENPSAS